MACLLTVLAWPAAAAAAGEADGADSQLQALVGDLRHLADRAETAGTASPALLQDLRDLVARYDVPFGHEIVRDTFQDGSFRTDPSWDVLAGEWQAVAGSVVSPPAGPALVTPSAEPDTNQLMERLETVTRLVDRMRSLDGRGEPETPDGADAGARALPVADAPARLALSVRVPPFFRLRTLMTLEDDPGRHRAGIMLRETQRGQTRDGYRFTVEAFATRSRVTLERLSAIGGQILGSALLDQSLAGGQVHTVVLERRRDRTLGLILNGETVIVADDRRAPPRLDQIVLERDSGRLIVSEVRLRAPAP